MLAGILIIAFSLALLIYWFRYSCILILRSQAAERRRYQTRRMLGSAFGRFKKASNAKTSLIRCVSRWTAITGFSPI